MNENNILEIFYKMLDENRFDDIPGLEMDLDMPELDLDMDIDFDLDIDLDF